MSIVSDAYVLRRQCRAEFEDYLEAQHQAAHEACNGQLLNRRGRAKGIDTRSLFLGSADRAYFYASPELVEWWAARRRLNYRMFEEQWVEDRPF